MSTAIADQRRASTVTRGSGTSFYYSFMFLPRPRREAIHALYAFCREVDDSVDAAETTGEAARRIAFWRGELAACYDGRPTHPITRSLAAHLRAYPIRRADLDHLIDGVEMDIAPRRYRTFEELSGYCYRVASAVGLACVEIFGYRDPATRDYAVKLGLAFQLTNILRDVGDDARGGRIYLPTEELQRFGCGEQELAARRPAPGFIDLMRFQAARARSTFEQARALLPEADRPALLAAEIMAAIYEAILDKIERSGYDVLSRRIALSRPRKLLIATRCFLRSRAARAA